MSQINQLQKKIMRRVYYAFALRMGTQPVVLYTALLIASVYGLSRVTHVASIINNIRGVQVGNLDNYILNTFMHTEFWTLALIGLIFFSAISIRLSLKPSRSTSMQTV
jgi:hypothetical protein